jgi:hypothetical protein
VQRLTYYCPPLAYNLQNGWGRKCSRQGGRHQCGRCLADIVDLPLQLVPPEQPVVRVRPRKARLRPRKARLVLRAET